MGIIYKFYEPEKGFEQIQANLYNDALAKYGTPGTATVDQIKERYAAEGFDNKSVQYAFDGDKPIAYIQTRKNEERKRIFIGYPWSTPDCPDDVKEKMFKDMLNYIYERDSDYEMVCGTIQEPWNDVHDFLKKFNVTVENEFKTFLLDISTLSKHDNSAYTSRIGTPDDEEALFKLCLSEPGFIDTFGNEEGVRGFAKTALNDLESILIYKNDDLVSAGAVTSFEPDNRKTIYTRYTATKDYNFENWKACAIEMAKNLEKKGLGGKKYTLFDRQPEHLEFYDKNASGSRTGITYAVPKL